MKRELRGFLLGVGLMVLWLVLVGAIEWPKGKYEFHRTEVSYFVLDTETGEIYLFDGDRKGDPASDWHYRGGPHLAKR